MKKIAFAIIIGLLMIGVNVFAQNVIIDSVGNVGMGTDSPTDALHIAGFDDALRLEGTLGDFNHGARLTFGDPDYTYIEETDDDQLTIQSGNVSFIADTIGFGVYPASVKVDISDSNGYEQLRLRTSYTPTSSSDIKGMVGAISWDNDYIYIKTSFGWKRAALSTW